MQTFTNTNKKDLSALLNTQETLRTLQLPDKKAMHECPVKECQKTFKYQGGLNKHYRIHTGERPHVCFFEGCYKSFTQISNLKRHKLIHTGDKPYQCKKCLKGFTTDSNLQQHRQTHVSKKSRKKYPCQFPLCNKSYYHQNSLKKHKKNFHIAMSTEEVVQLPSLTENNAKKIPVIRRVQSEPIKTCCINTQKNLIANLSQLVQTQELQLLSEQKQYSRTNSFNLYEQEKAKKYPQQSQEIYLSTMGTSDSFSYNEELSQDIQNIDDNYNKITSLFDLDDQLNRKRKYTQLFDNLDVEPELIKMTDKTNGIENELKLINMLDTQEKETTILKPIIPFQFDFSNSQDQSFQSGETLSEQTESCQLYSYNQNFNNLETQLFINQEMFFSESVHKKFF